MPSRRGVLAALGLGASGALSGCLTDLRPTTAAYLQVKGVSVAWHDDGRRWEDEILLASADGESEFRCRVAEEYAAIVSGPDEIHVTEEMERRIERDFADVTYVTGFCWSEAEGHTCRNPLASRTTFNRVQFGDRAEVVFHSPDVEVVDVYEGAQGDPTTWETEVTTFDFDELHDDDEVPAGGSRGVK